MCVCGGGVSVLSPSLNKTLIRSQFCFLSVATLRPAVMILWPIPLIRLWEGASNLKAPSSSVLNAS